ncbi:MAG: MFS transporter [Acaryochloridaceae cyanobacterium RL_2_7]|nr:MFS transporter [Acaryochloridaceae cyanobacterium RL_2_7]
MGSLTVMTGGVLAPILPEMIEQLPLDEAWAGVLVSTHYLMLAIFSPLLGLLADRFGKVRLLTLSLVVYSVLGMVGALLINFGWLLLDRALLGIATSGIAAGSLGLLTSMYQGDDRTQAIAYVSVTLTLANIIYPLLAGGIGAFQWQLAFLLYGVGIPYAVCAVVLFSPKRLQTQNRSSANPAPSADEIGKSMNLGIIFGQPAILKLIFSLIMVSAIVFGMVVYLPLFLQSRLGTDVGINGIVLACMAIGSALSAVFALKKLTQRLGVFRLIPLGLGLMAFILVLLPSLEQLSWIVLTATVFGVSFGVVTPSIYNGLANLTPNELQSSILATGIGAGFLGQFISPLIFGQILAIGSLTAVFYSAAAVSVATGLLLAFQPQLA